MGDLSGHPTHPDRQTHPTNHGDREPHLLNGGTHVVVNTSLINTSLINTSLVNTSLVNTSHLSITPSVA
jgi:hypothetical protein